MILFILCILILNTHGSVISSDLEFNRENAEVHYTTIVSIGQPHTRMMLSVDFSEDRIILFHRLSQLSISYSEDRGGTDIIFLGDERYRVNIVTDTSRSIPASRTACSDCDGVLGLAPGSIIWRIYPDISFTPLSLTLGKANDLFLKKGTCDSTIIECFSNTTDSLCTSTGEYRDSTYQVMFTSNEYSYLPVEVYESYTTGKNIFKDSPSKWEPFVITFKSPNSISNEEKDHLLYLGLDHSECINEYQLTIHGNDMIMFSDRKQRTLLIKPHEEDYIMLGIHTWKSFIVHKDAINDFIIIKSHEIRLRYTIFSLICIIFLTWSFTRWKTTDSANMESYEDRRMSIILDAVYQIACSVLTVVIYSLNETKDIVYEHNKAYYILMGIVICSEVVLNIACVVYILVNLKNATKMERFKYNVVKNVSFELLVLTGLCIALVQRRTEFLGTLLTLIVNAIITHVIFYYTVMIILFYVYRRNFTVLFGLFSFIIFPALVVFYILTSSTFFVSPLCKYYASQILEELHIGLVFVFYTLILTFTTYTIKFDYNKAMETASVNLKNNKSS